MSDQKPSAGQTWSRFRRQPTRTELDTARKTVKQKWALWRAARDDADADGHSEPTKAAAAPPADGAKLKLKPRAPSSGPSDNPMLDRLSLRRARPRFPRGMTVFLVAVLVGMVVAAAGLCVVDLGASTHSREMTRAVRALALLQTSPLDSTALDTLAATHNRIADTVFTREAKAGIATVHALGQLRRRNETGWQRTRDLVLDRYAKSRFAGMLRDEDMSTTCTRCKGTGKIIRNAASGLHKPPGRSVLEMGTAVPRPGTCPSCGGTGHAWSDKAVDARYGAAIDEAEQVVRTRLKAAPAVERLITVRKTLRRIAGRP